MGLVPESFATLQNAVDGVEAFLRTQSFDSTPVLLTQPPCNRDARREYLENALEALDSQLTTIQQLHDRIGVARNAVLRRRSLAFSALRTVTSLPPEVLRIVFSHLHGPEEGDTAVGITLSHVCTDWREVVRGYQRIWTASTINGMDDLAKLALPMSLSDTVHFSLTVGRARMRNPLSICALQNTLRERLYKLVWESGEDLKSFLNPNRGGQHSFPSLRRMVIYPPYDPSERLGNTFSFKDIALPSLVYLEFQSVRVVNAGSVIQHLKHLVLRFVDMTFTNFVVALEGATELETLEMDCVSTSDTIAPARFSTKREIDLPSLRTLKITGQSTEEAARTILGFFSMPNLHSLSIDEIVDEDYEDSYGTPWHHLPTNNPDLGCATFPNSLHKTISLASRLESLDLSLLHNAIRASIGALQKRFVTVPDISSLRSLVFQVNNSLSDYELDTPRGGLGEAHTYKIASDLGDLLLKVLERQASTSAPLEYLHTSARMNKDKFNTFVEEVASMYCDCPYDHSGLYESDDSDRDEDAE